MVQITNISLKGWRDDRTGRWNWTPEIQVEADPLNPELAGCQKKEVNDTLTSLRDTLMASVTGWDGGPAAPPQKPAEPPATIAKEAPKPVEGEAPDRGEGKVHVLGEGYDGVVRSWFACPSCGARDINHLSVTSQKPYQACRGKCKIFLNPDGTTAPIKARS
jgi:hypothetical protein